MSLFSLGEFLWFMFSVYFAVLASIRSIINHGLMGEGDYPAWKMFYYAGMMCVLIATPRIAAWGGRKWREQA